MTPSNAIFREIFAICKKNGATYDYLPDLKTEYPFYYVGESSNAQSSASELIGSVRQTVHIYAKRTQRNQLDQMVVGLHDGVRAANGLFDYHVQFENIDEQLLPDNSDVESLLHTVLDIRLGYTKKGI